jgi:hypothetical protein
MRKMIAAVVLALGAPLLANAGTAGNVVVRDPGRVVLCTVSRTALGRAGHFISLDIYADLFESDLAAMADNVSKLWPQSVQKGSIAP